MVAAKSLKAADKQAICRRLITTLKKRYKGAAPKNTLPVLETMLYAACLQNSSYNDAEAAFEKLIGSFFDLNEIRVSSIAELEAALSDLDDPEWRALRIRSVLQHVFEKNYEFQFEAIRRKTLDLAAKQLKRIHNIGSFIRYHTLQVMLGSHLVPVDEAMFNALVWIGLCDPESDPEAESEALKSAVRKADVPVFCYLIRCLATDPQLRPAFEAATKKPPKDGFDVEASPQRLTDLFKSPKKRAAAKKPATKKKAAKKTKSSGDAPKKKSVARSTRKKAAPKTSKKKAAKKKSSAAARSKKAKKSGSRK